MKKRVFAIIAAVLVLAIAAVPCFASGSAPSVSTSDISGILSAVTDQFSVSNITTFLAFIVGSTVVFVFLWWAVKRAYSRITGAAMRGKARV